MRPLTEEQREQIKSGKPFSTWLPITTRTGAIVEERIGHCRVCRRSVPDDPVRDKPRHSCRGRIAWTAEPSYNGVAADNQGSLRQGMPEVTLAERT